MHKLAFYALVLLLVHAHGYNPSDAHREHTQFGDDLLSLGIENQWIVYFYNIIFFMLIEMFFAFFVIYLDDVIAANMNTFAPYSWQRAKFLAPVSLLEAVKQFLELLIIVRGSRPNLPVFVSIIVGRSFGTFFVGLSLKGLGKSDLVLKVLRHPSIKKEIAVTARGADPDYPLHIDLTTGSGEKKTFVIKALPR